MFVDEAEIFVIVYTVHSPQKNNCDRCVEGRFVNSKSLMDKVCFYLGNSHLVMSSLVIKTLFPLQSKNVVNCCEKFLCTKVYIL